MTAGGPDPVARVDDPEGSARSTQSLVASLRDRLASLNRMSGAEAIGSLMAGYAVVGRHAARTAEGRVVADALRSSETGANGDAVWSALGIDRLIAATPSPVLDHLRNDLALLMAEDLDDALRKEAGAAATPGGGGARPRPEPVDSVDYLVGMWLVSRELVAVVEALAAPAMGAPVRASTLPRVEGPLLR